MIFIFNAAALLGAFITGGLYYLGMSQNLFWTLPWYDIPMHILGGVTFGLWGAAVATRYKMSPLRALLFIVSAVFFFGGVWEMWEYTSGLTKGIPNYWLDTSKDLADDVVGGLLASCVYYLFSRKNKK